MGSFAVGTSVRKFIKTFLLARNPQFKPRREVHHRKTGPSPLDAITNTLPVRTMVTYSSYALDKLVLSVVDENNPTRVMAGVPVMESAIPVDSTEARLILMRWMSAVSSMNPEDEILLSFSGRNFTVDGAAELATFTSLGLISSRVTIIEFSGALGEHHHHHDAMAAQELLVESLMRTCYYRAVKLDNLTDRDVKVLRRLLAKETLTLFHLTDCHLDADRSLSKIESSLIHNIPETAYQPCNSLQHLGFSNLHLGDEGDTGANIFATILSKCTSITSVQYTNCHAGTEGTEAIAEKLSCLILGNVQVRESLRSVELEGCVLNDSFGLICDPLARVKYLEYVNLRDCELTNSQKEKIAYKLGITKRENPPTLCLEWEAESEGDEDDGSSDEDEGQDDQYEFEYSQAWY